MKKLRFQYPKFLIFLATIALAYFLFQGRTIPSFHNFLLSLGYIGTFLAGIFFVYGFTAAPATAILLILSAEQNILLAGLIAGLGALIGDLIIFKFIRYSFSDEISRLSKEKFFIKINEKTPLILKKYFVPVLAGFIIASPLPDEVGIALIAMSRTISTKIFSILSYVLNTSGILIILLIGTLI